MSFLDAAESMFQHLAEHPGVGRQLRFGRPELEGLRCFRMRGFENHFVFYRPHESGIEVVRVLQGSAT
jgi:toxin ParE1/3/4